MNLQVNTGTLCETLFKKKIIWILYASFKTILLVTTVRRHMSKTDLLSYGCSDSDGFSQTATDVPGGFSNS